MEEEQLRAGEGVIDVKYPCYICRDLLCCFTQALNNQLGANYDILLYLGYQIVAGTNYKLFCKQTLIANPPKENLAIVTIYQPLNGNCQITSVEPIF